MAAESKVQHWNEEIEPTELLSGTKSLISLVRPSWNIDNTKFKVFTEGISNQLVGCFPANEDLPLLVRVYGVGTDLFLDRDAEKKNMVALAKFGLGPELIATFVNGLIYYYVPGSVLTVDNISNSKIWPLVARQLGSMHRLPVTTSSVLWDRLQRFIDLMPDNFLEGEKFIRVKNDLPGKEALQTEKSWLQGKLEDSPSPVVFCHNDLLIANIIFNEDANEITFIDYEYGGANHQAFDIANHFVEYAGVDNLDFSRIPSLDYQRLWIREYLMAYWKNPVLELDVTECLHQVQQFCPVSHFFWGIWAIVQAIHSAIDFDFAHYAKLKLGEYKNIKHYVETEQLF